MNFKDNLTKIMNDRNINNNQLALSIGVSRGMITDYKNGKSRPTFETLEKITIALECDYNTLLK